MKIAKLENIEFQNCFKSKIEYKIIKIIINLSNKKRVKTNRKSFK